MLRQSVNRIAVVDFGGQYTHLIAKRIRHLGVYGEIVSVGEIASGGREGVLGMILSGGPDSVVGQCFDKIRRFILETEVPVLGICFGHQLLAQLFGGKIGRKTAREYGHAWVECDTNAVLFRGLASQQRVWMSHGDHVESLPDRCRITGRSEAIPVASFESLDQRYFGLQFHPEVTHTESGQAILDNFLSLCTHKRSWTYENIEREIVEEITAKAGDKRLFLLVSGGVDSLVTLDLCIKAVGKDRVISLHVDTGFMRENESSEVMGFLQEQGYGNLSIFDASGLFFESLARVVDPEEKRRIIGRLFVEVVEERMRELEDGAEYMLVQGTIYPDRIESGATKKADKIKTHHNRVEEIQRLIDQGRVIEPIGDLYKNEVRELGLKLGLPEHLVQRRPFPGPGLAVRIIASDTNIPPSGYDGEVDRLKEIIFSYGFDGMILPVKSVGVQGDARTYQHPAVIWSTSASFDWTVAKKCALEIINTLRTVNRVLLSRDVIGTEELHLGNCFLERSRVALLRRVDAVVREMVADIEEIWQIPVVGLPLFDGDGKQTFVLRPVCSSDAMTADVYEMEQALLEKILKRAKEMEGVGRIFYDITTKPPGTIEWE